MKKTYLLFLLSLFIFTACSDDDNGNDNGTQDDKDKIEVSAEMKYKSGETYLPDAGAQIYLFEDFSDYVNYSYVGNGVYKSNTTDKTVSYTLKGVAGDDGIAKLKAGYGHKSLVVWESKNVKGKYGQNVYEIVKDQQPIKISQIYFSDTSQPTYPF